MQKKWFLVRPYKRPPCRTIYYKPIYRISTSHVSDNIYVVIEKNAETEEITIGLNLGVWDENGNRIFWADNLAPKYKKNGPKGVVLPTVLPNDQSYVICILQVKKWEAKKIIRPVM